MIGFLRSLLLIATVMVPSSQLLAQSNPATTGGAACVIAKKQGHSQAIEWVIGAQTVDHAIKAAKKILRERGYTDLFPQANSALPHGWATMIKVQYKNPRGRVRISYGCGFSHSSEKDAIRLATEDLRSFSWAWRPELGYDVVQSQRY